jgi:alpha-galactosidase
VDLIKLDYITPGSPSNGGNLPPDNSGSVIAYHRAIQKTGRQIRLDVSWKLERKNRKFFDIWSANADSMRTDQDINNSKSNTFVKWATVQRAIDNYCDFSSLAVSVSKNPTLSIFPDMDNMFVGNDKSITGVGDAQRETIATHWICAAANLITGSDLTRLDELGIKLLTDEKAQAAADFTSKFPMQPRNPGTGRNDSRQLQAWIAGPSEGGTGRAIVILVNYGPDEGQGGFGTQLKGPQVVSVSWADLGLHGAYKVYNIWARTDDGVADGYITATLDEGESVMLDLVPVA